MRTAELFAPLQQKKAAERQAPSIILPDAP
jgi:hypothetical protein